MIANCDLFVASDSGPMHLASAGDQNVCYILEAKLRSMGTTLDDRTGDLQNGRVLSRRFSEGLPSGTKYHRTVCRCPRSRRNISDRLSNLTASV
jgi:Glycosyltransferase family 9 (heptosyltransferase)